MNKENNPPAARSCPSTPTPRARTRTPATSLESTLKSQVKTAKKKLDNEQHKNRRLKKKVDGLTDQIRDEKPLLANAQKGLVMAARSANESEKNHAASVGFLSEQLEHSRDQNKAYQKKIQALKKQVSRMPARLAKAVEKAKKLPALTRLTKKGVYTPQVRALARLMVKTGTSRANVGMIMRANAEIHGITIKKAPCARTVGLTIIEGGVAAQMQIGYEMGLTKCECFQ